MYFDQKEDLLRCGRNELVPENPQIAENGVKGLLYYRCNNNQRHPDSALTYKDTMWISVQLYGSVPESQDTIFNCWNMIKIYDALYREKETRCDSAILASLEKGEQIFAPEHEETFDILADMQHSIANMMPAPQGFNGWKNKWKNHHGKGEYDRDNDFPDIYYLRAKEELPKMFKWINDHMVVYSLQCFKEFRTPWKDRHANYKNMNPKPTIEVVERVARDMIEQIRDRAELLSVKLPIYDDKIIL